jgi:hypothetical protein
MAVRCEASNAGSDLRCSVCGQGFLIHWAGHTAEEQAELRGLLLRELRRQHAAMTDHPAAHPASCFQVHEPDMAAESLTPGSAGEGPVWEAFHPQAYATEMR